MKTEVFWRILVPALFLLAIFLFAGGVGRYGYRQALDQLADRGRADLALAVDRLSGQLQRYQELAVLLSDHPDLAQATQDTGRASRLLLNAADKTAALDILYADRTGKVLAHAEPAGPVSISDQPYFQRAMQGALGTGHGIYGDGGLRAFFYAAPNFDLQGQVAGALIVVVDIADVEWDWRGSQPAVYFTDEGGDVFITNRSELLFWQAKGDSGIAPEDGSVREPHRSFVGPHEIWRVDWGAYIPKLAMHLSREIPVIGMTGTALMDVAPARRLGWLQGAVVAAVCLAFGTVLYLTMERRRVLALANAQLEGRVAERTAELSGANLKLRREIHEREEAEAALKKAQAELVQAGKLSALGQMSAGISHELNQPLMAIQQFADNGAAFLEKGKPGVAGENLSRISQLAARAARIIKNLRAFARNESEPMSKVDLVQVINTAVELTETRLRNDRIALEWDPPKMPVHVWGGEVRLGQVFVNLINNAADAMGDQDRKYIRIDIRTEGQLSVAIRDSGPGIADPEKIFEPFYSTKEVSGGEEGMGLGLSISYGLVQSFGGNIRGSNAEGGGAVFTVELDPWREEQVA